MNLKHAFLFFMLFLIPFISCKKDIVALQSDLSNDDGSSQQILYQLRTLEERNFFTKNFITQNNPFIKSSVRDRNDQVLIDSVYNFMFERHLETGFITELMEANGYPIWDMSEVAEDGGGTTVKFLITPYANVDEDFTSAYIIAIPHSMDVGDPWSLILVTRSEVLDMIQQFTYDDKPGLGFHVSTFLHFDELLFGSIDPDLENWMPDVIRGNDDNGFSGYGGGRCEIITYCVCRCQPMAFSPGNEDRNTMDCPGGSLAFCDEITVTIDCDEEGSGDGNGAGTGSGVGGPINTNSSDIPSNNSGGSSSPNVNQVAMNEFIQNCLASIAANESGGDTDPNDESVNTNPANISQCEELITVAEALGLITETGEIVNYTILDHLINNAEGRALVAAIFTLVEQGASPEKIEVIIAYTLHQMEEGEMEFRAFEMLYMKVYFEVVPYYEMDIVQDGEFLMDNPDIADELNDFKNNTAYTNTNAKKTVGNAYNKLLQEQDAELNETINALKEGIIPGGDIIWDILKTQLADVLQDIVIELLPGGSIVTIGPELLDNIRTGNWLDAMYNALDIALEEAETFIPAAKIASTSLALVGHYKDIKKLYKAFDKAKKVGVDFVVKFYTYMINKWTPKQIRNKFKWLGGSNGAKLDGEGANSIKDDLLSIFGGFTVPFLYQGHPVYKLNFSPPGFPNKRVYMQLYPDANFGTAWNIGFYSGKENALAPTDITWMPPLYKIRFDNF